jgi:hypothetical protein
MERILWAVAAIAFAGFAVSLFFPALKVPPRRRDFAKKLSVRGKGES